MTRNGGVHEENKESSEAVAASLQFAGQWRNQEATRHQEAPKMFDATQVPDSADSFKDASQYYGTERGQHERSNQRVPLMSYDLMVSYDSFNFQRLISPRPLLMIAGSKAQTLHYSREAVDAAKEPKGLFVVADKNHFDLYDDLSESGPKLVEFYGKYHQ
jgi:hypothetical protein